MARFIGYKHKPCDITDERTGEVKHFDRVECVFVTDKQPDYNGLYAFSHKVDHKDIRILNCSSVDDLDKRLKDGKTTCIVESVPLANGKMQLTEVHWADSI